MKSRMFGIILVLMLMGSLIFGGYAQAAEKVRWTMQTTWSKGWLLHEMAEDFAKRVSDMSGGNFEIKVLPAGAVVGAMENMDATSKGTLDGWHSWTGYWQGKHPSANFFASIPMHLDRELYQNHVHADMPARLPGIGHGKDQGDAAEKIGRIGAPDCRSVECIARKDFIDERENHQNKAVRCNHGDFLPDCKYFS